jgi:predicted extracellular nuclease
MDPNPDHVCFPKASTIPVVRDSGTAIGTAVIIQGVVVTGIDSQGFTVQDPTVTDGMNAGIYAFVGSKPTLTIGDVVTVAGTKNDYFMRLEHDGAVIQNRASGTPLAPIVMTVAQSQVEAYESVLVQVNDVTSVTATYACSADDPNCKDANLWLVTSADNMPLIVYNQMFVGGATAWTNAITAAGQTPTVTGVMNYRFNRRRIMPRSSADIVP